MTRAAQHCQESGVKVQGWYRTNYVHPHVLDLVWILWSWPESCVIDKWEREQQPDMGAEPDEEDIEEENGSDDVHLLLFFYDCKTIGFSIYDEHLTEVAAKVVRVPLSKASKPVYSSLVHAPQNIPKKSKCFSFNCINVSAEHLQYIIQCPTQLELITTAFLCHKRKLSVVLPEFLQWLHITTQEISEASSAPHTPGNYTPCVWVYRLIHWCLFPSPCCSQWLQVWLPNSSDWNSCNHLVAQHLHFADTLPHLRHVQSCILDMFLDTVHAYTCNHFIQAKKDGHHGPKDVCKFGLESLYCDFFPSKTYPGMILLPRT